MPGSTAEHGTAARPLPTRARVVIVGAGQAGLSVAYHLQRRGLTPGSDLVVLDRGPGAGGAWQFRWESLRLGTAHRVNDLPGMRDLGLSFDTADQTRAARDVVGEYYERYEQYFGLAVFRPVEVLAVRSRGGGAGAPEAQGGDEAASTPKAGGAGGPEAQGGDEAASTPKAGGAGWPETSGDEAAAGGGRPGGGTTASTPTLVVETSRGSIEADVVVNASGTWAAPVRPFVPGIDSFRGLQIATPEYRAANDFSGKRVIVVGGGTSAVGFLRELEGVAASTYWVTRRPVVFGEATSGIAATAGGVALESRLAAVARQDEAAREGRVLPSIISGTGLPDTPENLDGVAGGLLVAHPMFTSIEPTGVRFADGSFEPADAIIWATGFRAELGHLDPLRLREPGGGVRVEQGRALRDGRVFLAGYGPQASTIGANRAGRLVALQVLDALQHGPGHPHPSSRLAH